MSRDQRFKTSHGVQQWVVLTLLLWPALTAGRPAAGPLTPPPMPPSPGPVSHGCMRHLHHRIERCLDNYEQLLQMFRDESLGTDQRNNMKPRFCHQYLVTLQCLHEVLDQCPAQPEHLDLIEARLGYLRGFMLITCNSRSDTATTKPPFLPPIDKTNPTLLPSDGTHDSTTTQLPSFSPDGSSTTTATPSTSTPPTKSPDLGLSKSQSTDSNRIIKHSTGSLHNSVTTELSTRRPEYRKRTTAHLSLNAEMKFQLLFGDQISKTTLSESDTKSYGALHETLHKHLVPVMTATQKHNDNTLLKARAEKQVDCTVDEHGKIDIRCIFSGSSIPSLSLPTLLVALVALVLNILC